VYKYSGQSAALLAACTVSCLRSVGPRMLYQKFLMAAEDPVAEPSNAGQEGQGTSLKGSLDMSRLVRSGARWFLKILRNHSVVPFCNCS
jgi:hypothetical protein